MRADWLIELNFNININSEIEVMIGKLTDDQIIHVFHSQRIGRIACHDEGRLYIVPVSYAFDKGYIYCHSMDGLKIKMMRNNPSVCFQVDDIDNMTNWRSVIAWGDYEELQQEEYDSGLEILKNKFNPFITSDAVNPFHRPDPTRSSIIEKAKKVIVFRIRIVEQSGRFEK